MEIRICVRCMLLSTLRSCSVEFRQNQSTVTVRRPELISQLHHWFYDFEPDSLISLRYHFFIVMGEFCRCLVSFHLILQVSYHFKKVLWIVKFKAVFSGRFSLNRELRFRVSSEWLKHLGFSRFQMFFHLGIPPSP